MTDQLEAWLWSDALEDSDREKIQAVVELLQERGPALRRPSVGQVVSSRHHNMKELIPPASNIRILFGAAGGWVVRRLPSGTECREVAVMAGHKNWNTSAKRILDRPGARQRVDGYKREVELATELADVREMLGVTQAQLAERLKTTQPNVSRIEHVDDIHLSTLVQYFRALGGKLLLEVVFPSQTFELDAESVTSVQHSGVA